MIQVSCDADHDPRWLRVNHAAGCLQDCSRSCGQEQPADARFWRGFQVRGTPDRGDSDRAVSVKYTLSEGRGRPASLISRLSGHQATIRRLEPIGRRHLARPDDNFWASESELVTVARRFGKGRRINAIRPNTNSQKCLRRSWVGLTVVRPMPAC